MKTLKRISILFSISLVLIVTNVNSLNVHASSSIDLSKLNYTINTPINEITIDDVKETLNVDDNIAAEIVDSLKFLIYIQNNWNDLKVEKDMDLYNSTDKSVGKPGDILIAGIDPDNPDKNAIKLGSLTTHAAMVDSDPKKVLEVMENGVNNLENDWRTRYKKILVVRPKTNKETINNAIKYGHTKIGTPFHLNIFNKLTTDEFYCSAYVWRCYFNSGLDLDRNGGKAVLPYDFISDKTTIVYKQGE